MSETTKKAPESALQGLQEVQRAQKKGLPPVHLWNPPFCGDLDMRVARDGTWYYLGSPIRREALVILFSSVIRLDDDGKYYLVTPVEKIGIKVDDAPFVAVDMDVEGEGREQVLSFTTQVGDKTTVDDAHPIRFEFDQATNEPSPYVLVRANLEALIGRAVYYKLVDLAVEAEVDGERKVGVWSCGRFFSFANSEDLNA